MIKNLSEELFIIDLEKIIFDSLRDVTKYNRRFGSSNQCFGIGQNEFQNVVDRVMKKIERKYDLGLIKEK